jgi:membrane fusion protein, heavy metal efflux system
MTVWSCSKKEKSGTGTSPSASPHEIGLTAEQFKVVDVRLGKVEHKVINDLIRTNGVLDVPPQNLVTISAPFQGFVKSTELLQGMKITKGQVLVTLEHPDYIQLQQDYLESKSQLDFLESEYHRQQELAKDNVNATKTLELSKSSYLGTKAKVQGLLAKLGILNINMTNLDNGQITGVIFLYAPINGYVTQVNVNIGQHVNPADVMFKIVDTHHLHAEAQVFEKDIPRIKIGQKVTITLANDPRPRHATVYLIGKEITADRTIRVHCHFEEEDINLIPGQYFSAFIEANSHSIQALPAEAIVGFEGKDYIFTPAAAERTYELIEITKGAPENGYCAVTLPHEVDPDAPIVIHGSYELLGLLMNSKP